MRRPPTRFLLYSHDTFGLGHFRRTSSIAAAIVAADPTAQVLIATGSPVAGSFGLPERVDVLTLPSATKSDEGRYRPRKVTDGLDHLVRLRSAVLVAACTEFAPHAVLVDHAPVGMAGELIPLLRSCTTRPPWSRPRLVLGLREIIDEADRTDAAWAADHSWSWLPAYDEILVYGDGRLVTTADELRLGQRLGSPVRHVGFVAPPMPPARPGRVLDGRPYVLVTTGGGADGDGIVERHLDAVEAGALDGLASLVVTGPLMAGDRRRELAARAQRLPDVTTIEFTDDLRGLIASATVVVSMAGYNTVAEELAAGVPALLVPRTAPRLEQDLRARRLAPHGALERCTLEELSPDRIGDVVQRWAAGSVGRVLPAVDLGGAGRAARLLVEAVDHAAADVTARTPAHATRPDASVPSRCATEQKEAVGV